MAKFELVLALILTLFLTLRAEQLDKEGMYTRGHMKPFGSHRKPIPVEELKYMISPEDFYMNFVVQHKPVVFKKVTQNWPAFDLWTDEYLLKTYGERKMQMETKDDDKINLPPSRPMKDFLKIYNESNLYMVDEVIPEMREEVQLPLCLRCEEINRFFFVSYYWHSNGGTMSTVHIDTDENLLCVIKGHKKVLTVSPIYSHDLYTDDSRLMGVLDLNSSAVDFDKYPRVMNIEYHEAMLEEGDCVYIPQMWWHQVYSRKERQQAIAMWWKSKPFWKNVKGSRSFRKPKEQQNRKHSYADSLIDYEHWVQNVTGALPRIRCTEQNRKMSAYQWETDKNSSVPTTLGDGGTLEEEIFDEQYGNTPSRDVKETLKRRLKETDGGVADCDFDLTNPKNPCLFKSKHGVTDEEGNFEFIRYVMDYCREFEDRGCVINKPHLLNKLMNIEFEKMAFDLKSPYKLENDRDIPATKMEL